MQEKMTELKTIFEFVRKHQWSTARQIGKNLNGDKSRANHFLYGYLDILFERRGFSPPHWKVKSDNAYDNMIERLNPLSTPIKPTSFFKQDGGDRKVEFDPSISKLIRELPRFSICNSCGLPIKPTGACGCS